jgi:hypothetical protein
MAPGWLCQSKRIAQQYNGITILSIKLFCSTRHRDAKSTMANVASNSKSQKHLWVTLRGALPSARGVALLSDPSPIRAPEITFQSDPSPTRPVASASRLYHPPQKYVFVGPLVSYARAREVSYFLTSTLFSTAPATRLRTAMALPSSGIFIKTA